MKLYGNRLSGNCYKPWAVARLLEIPLDYQEIDILQGEARTPAFRERNPDGRVPVLELPDGRVLTESNAIAGYLAEGSTLIPEDPWDRAQLARWLFFEQNTHEPTVASSRFLRCFAAAGPEAEERLALLRARGLEALTVLEGELVQRDWLAAGRFTLADLALYPYTSVADEAGFPLGDFPAILEWLSRVESVPGLPPFRDFVAGAASRD